MAAMSLHSSLPSGQHVPPTERNGYIPRGYPKLSVAMATFGDMAIFRTFRELNMLNLLSLQAELTELHIQFQDICHEDDTSSDPSDQVYSSYFHSLRGSRNTPNNEQLEMLLRIRQKLREDIAGLSTLREPNKNDLRTLHNWLASSEGGNYFLKGSEVFMWDDEKDLAKVFNPPGERLDDPFSKWLTSNVLQWYHALWGHRRKTVNLESGMSQYHDLSLIRISTVVATTASSILPLLAVLVLWYVKDTVHRILVMIGFTTLFAASLAIFTSARRIEIFAATASG
ncbi:uncharacterized protein ATNIH1004_010512 [Aspergillus tanneri]|uniref:DUF6594 domain-containing protein n=1 Tax=Aspergillus tanneri TaxID=1220188 RepID=A0A5M9MA23_9EURO|nr:uncharacterized protein ATNIH1004_010512 [Aspergillus tanneri]KAA8643738.1 hypothetical protein ATNIH1004_010512 [Aspergillus tanneri]